VSRNRRGPGIRRRLRRVLASVRAPGHDLWTRPAAAVADVRRRWVAYASAAAVATLALAIVLFGGRLTTWVRTHPYFAVAEIVVNPTVRVRPGALLQWVGLRPGVSLWSIDPEGLAAHLTTHPWILTAEVRREFPRRLVVHVTERQPVAVVLIDQLYYLDRSGTIFARLGAEDTLDLPFVTGIEAAVLAGERPYPRHAIRQALKLLDLLRLAGLPFRVSEVHIEREQGVTVFPVDPQVALSFGWGRFPAKVARLRAALVAFSGREGQIREIDLTYDAQAVIRLRGPRGRRQRARA